MKKLKWIYIFLVILGAVVLPARASENEDEDNLVVDHLQIRSYIQLDGSLQIQQVYKVENFGKTEFRTAIAKPTNESKISNISVRSNDVSFRENYDWDPDIGIEDKANTFGVIEHDDHYEIVIAVAEEGESNYSLFYTIDNAIKQYDGFEGMYVNFINKNMEVAPDSVSIMIEKSNEILNEENSDVMVSIEATSSFFEDGVIRIRDGRYFPGRSIGVLGKFDNVVGQEKDAEGSFDQLVEDAIAIGDGFDENNGSRVREMTSEDKFKERLPFIIFGLAMVIIAIVIIISLLRRVQNIKENVPQNLSESTPALSYMTRTVPADKYLPCIFWLDDPRTVDHKGHMKIDGIMAAYILEWLNKGYINIVKERESKIVSNKYIQIELLETPDFECDSERAIYQFIKATGVRGEITSKTGKKYVRSNTDYYEVVSSRVYKDAIKFAKDQGYIKRNDKKHMYLTDKGQKEFQDTYGFKNFIMNFRKENSRRRVDKEIWDEILIYATALGVGVDLSKELNDLDSNYTIAHPSIQPRYRAKYYVDSVVDYAEGIHDEYIRKINENNS